MANYKDLKVYEKSYAAALEVYRLTKDFPKDETFGLVGQLKRAATSIPLNIAEGYGKRGSEAEFKRFLSMSLGSSDEMRVLINFSHDLGYIKEDVYQALSVKYDEIGKDADRHAKELAHVSEWRKQI